MINAGIYLDHNATTPLRPEAAAAMTAAMAIAGNGSSVHRHGRLARRLIEDAREQVALLVGAEPAEVVFTSGGTEANALALLGCGRRRRLVSDVEHASVLQNAPGAERLPVDGEGVVRIDALDRLLAASSEPAVVSVMLANNETGVIQPLAEIARIARRHGALVHSDGAQAAGRIEVDVRRLGIDLLSLSAHKLGGPAGVGALVTGPDVPLTALLAGGGQERGRRAGSENRIGIAGFGAAADVAARREGMQRLAALRDTLEQRLCRVAPTARIPGAGAPRLPNTSCIVMPGVPGETQVIAFDLAGVSISAGAACSSGKVTGSHVLAAMGVGEEIANCSIRVSLGWTTTDADVERIFEVWTSVYARLCGSGEGSGGLAVASSVHWNPVGKVTE